MFGAFSLSTVLLVGLYVYGGITWGLARARSGGGFWESALYGATWPATAYSAISKLEHKAPPK